MIEKIKKIFLCSSILFLITSITCFIAYNWKEMSNFEKMALPMGLIIAGIVGWFLFNNKKLYGDLCLFLSSFSVGFLFVVFSQIYQTGANEYTLFLNWGLFIIIFSIVTDFSLQWFLNIIVFSLAIGFYPNLEGRIICIAISAFYLLSIIFYYFGYIYFKKSIERWLINTLAFISIVIMTFSTVREFFDYDYYYFNMDIFNPLKIVTYAFYIIILGTFYLLNTKFFKEEIIKSSLIASIMIVISSFILKNMSWESAGGILSTFIIIMCIFLFGLKLILHKHVKSPFVKLIANILKAILVLIIIGVVFAFMAFIGIDIEENLIIFGILSIILSFFMTFMIKPTDNNKLMVLTVEMVLFIVSIIMLFIYFGFIKNFTASTIAVALYVLYLLFWKLKKSTYLKYFVVPGLMGVIGCFEDLRLKGSEGAFFLMTIPIILLASTLFIDREKLKEYKEVFMGSEIYLLGISIYYVVTNRMLEFEYYWREERSNFKNIFYFYTALIFISTIYFLYREFYQKDKKLFGILAVIIGGIELLGFSMNNLDGGRVPHEDGFYIVLGIFFLISYLYRKDIYMFFVSVIFIIYNTFQYYFSLAVPLNIKSYIFIQRSVVLFVGFLIISFYMRKKGMISDEE